MSINALDRDKMQAILTSIIEGVIVFDFNGKIIFANRAAENMFMSGRGSLIGRGLRDINMDIEISQMVDEVLSSGKEVFTETAMYPQNLVYRVHARPFINDAGQIEGAVVVLHDVTDIRNFAQIRSEFAGNVSHELRTPLTSIKGFVETLLDGAMENSTTCRRFLSIIDTETDRLSRLIEDLLTLSSIESKERMVYPRPVCMVRSIRAVMNMLAPQVSEKALRLELAYPPDLPMVHADEDLMGQVLINLVDNAIKYTPRGGSIFIRCFKKDSRLITTIRDTGMGIPQESLSRVFERFYRVDKARSRSQGGTGLGLAIVKHIVESHGGEVFVESEIGKGSTFGVSFLVV